MQALVVNCQRNGLGIIRSLGQQKVRVIAVDHYQNAPGMQSRYTSERVVVKHPSEDEEGFINEIIAIGQRVGATVRCCLLPMNDEYVLTFARHWERLSQWFYPIFETNSEILLDCLEKTRMYKVAQRANVPYPNTAYSPLTESDYDRLAFPVVVKPHNRRSQESIRHNLFRIKICQNSVELREIVQFMSAIHIPFVVQEFIPGGDDQLYTAGIFAFRGEICGAFTGRKLRQFPPRIGECSYGELVDEPKLIEYAARFVETAHYTGIAQVEFKKYADEYYLMEINPRSWSWNSLSTYAGVNLPWIACKTVVTGQMQRTHQTRYTGTWIYPLVDITHNVLQEKNVSLIKALFQAVSANMYAYWAWDDPMPSVYVSLKELVRYSGILKKQRQSDQQPRSS